MLLKIFIFLPLLAARCLAKEVECLYEMNAGSRYFHNMSDYQANKIPFNPADDAYDGNYVRIANVNGALHQADMKTFESDYITHLDLSNNSITVIKMHAFYEMCCLQKLYLKHNQIYALESEAFKNPYKKSLQLLTLRGNKLERVPTDVFEDHKELANLDLSDNHIKTLSGYLFGDLQGLTVCNISHNHLKDISLQQLAMSGNLSILDVSFNSLKRVNFMVDFKFMSLSRLYLAGNQLIELNMIDLKSTMPFLKFISLLKNPWPCTTLHFILTALNISRTVHDIGNVTELSVDGIDCTNYEPTTASPFTEELDDKVSALRAFMLFMMVSILVVVFIAYFVSSQCWSILRGQCAECYNRCARRASGARLIRRASRSRPVAPVLEIDLDN